MRKLETAEHLVLNKKGPQFMIHTSGILNMDSFSFELSSPLYILFKEWKIETLSGFVGSTLFIFSFAILCECFKGLLRYYDSVCSVEDKDGAKNRYNCLLLKTFYHVLNMIGGYFLMLVVMTYNAWLIVAIVIGTGFAYFITGPLIMMYVTQFKDDQYRTVAGSRESISGSSSKDHGPSRSIAVSTDGRKTELIYAVSAI